MLGRRIILILVLIIVGAGFGAVIVNVPQGGSAASVRDENPAVRAAAIRAMGWHGDANLLIEALRDENADVRLLAAEHLGERGPQGERRAAALVEALKDPHAGVRRVVAESLCSIGPESALALIKAVTDPDPQVRAGAALALGDVGMDKGSRQRAPNEVQTITPLLNKLLDDEDAEVRRKAAGALEVLSREVRYQQ
jgi:HEAT repeat protein